jgi:hypothetical protein
VSAPLELPPEAVSPALFDLGLDVWDTFPFQRAAMVYAEWCNAAGPERVRQLKVCKQGQPRSRLGSAFGAQRSWAR